MYLPTLIFGVTINITMVAMVVWILALMFEWILSSCPFVSTSSSPPWNYLNGLSIWNR